MDVVTPQEQSEEGPNGEPRRRNQSYRRGRIILRNREGRGVMGTFGATAQNAKQSFLSGRLPRKPPGEYCGRAARTIKKSRIGTLLNSQTAPDRASHLSTASWAGSGEGFLFGTSGRGVCYRSLQSVVTCVISRGISGTNEMKSPCTATAKPHQQRSSGTAEFGDILQLSPRQHGGAHGLKIQPLSM